MDKVYTIDGELQEMIDLANEFEIPLRDVMLVNATLNWAPVDYDLRLVLVGIYNCTSVG